MLYAGDVTIDEVYLHQVGNRSLEEGVKISASPLHITDRVGEALKRYFFESFNTNEMYHLTHDVNVEMNELYVYVSAIFDDEQSFQEQSENIARYLYKCSNHPNIKPGELCVAYLRDCQVDGEIHDAVGIFKSENKDTFLKIIQNDKSFGVESDEGINVGKLDKGCLIFNTDREDGYVLTVVDQTNKGVEARFWSDEFLQLKHRRDIYFNTQNLLSACKSFVSEALPEEYEIEKADQIDLLNKSISYFKDNERFVQEEFEGAVFKDPEVIESFKKHQRQVADEEGLDIPTSFEISQQAVKKKANVFKSVIKLDKNFHIYVHGRRDWIERGEDSDGRKFYKVYYENEA